MRQDRGRTIVILALWSVLVTVTVYAILHSRELQCDKVSTIGDRRICMITLEN